MKEQQKVLINPKLVFLVFGIIGGVYLAYLLKNVIILFFISFILSSGFRPFVDKLETYKIPRFVSVILLYIGIIIFSLLIIGLTINTFINQLESFTNDLPNLVRTILNSINDRLPEQINILDGETIDDIVNSVNEQIKNLNFTNVSDLINFSLQNLGEVGNTGVKFASSIFTLLFSVFIVLVVTAYITVRRQTPFENIETYIPEHSRAKIKKLFTKVEKGLGEWVVGQIILMLIIGTITYLLIQIPHIVGVDSYELYRFALLIALIAGILEAFPNIGPTLTLIISLLLGIGTGESLGVLMYIGVAFIALQQLEGLFITPNLMNKLLHLDPIIVILGLVAGFQIHGLVGAIISIPVVITLRVILREINLEKLNPN